MTKKSHVVIIILTSIGIDMKKLIGILEFVFGLGGIECGNIIIDSGYPIGYIVVIAGIILAFIGCVNFFKTNK